MHILLIVIMVFFYFFSKSFRLLINASVISLVIAFLSGVLGSYLFNDSTGIFIGILAFIFSISVAFKALKMLSEIITSSAVQGATEYAVQRAKGHKHENAAVDGGAKAIETILKECATRDNNYDWNVKPNQSAIGETPEYYEASRLDIFFEAVFNSDIHVLHRIQNELQPSELVELVNAEDSMQDRPLHIAVRNNSVPVLTWLIANGAKANSMNYWDKTPLDLAKSLNHSECANYLEELKLDR